MAYGVESLFIVFATAERLLHISKGCNVPSVSDEVSTLTLL